MAHQVPKDLQKNLNSNCENARRRHFRERGRFSLLTWQGLVLVQQNEQEQKVASNTLWRFLVDIELLDNGSQRNVCSVFLLVCTKPLELRTHIYSHVVEVGAVSSGLG